MLVKQKRGKQFLQDLWLVIILYQITNPDVKQASGKVAAALSDMVNFGKKYQSNPNAADQKEAERLMENLTTSLYSLGNLCPSLMKK